jgi:hypothetical protein
MTTPTVIQVINSATSATSPAINVGDPVNNAVRVNVVAGGGGGSSNINIQEFGGTAVTIGQQLSAASMPVVIASDQSAVTVAQATAASLKAQVVGAGTAGTPNANPVTIQGISGMTAITVVGAKTNNSAAPGSGNVGALVGIANAAAPTYNEGDQVLLSTDLSGNLRTSGGGGGGGSAANLQASPQTLFDATTNQAGVSQLGALFPTTIAITTGLPTVGSGSSTTLTNSSNVCGAVFSGATTWGSALLQIAGVTGTAGETITVEIGRVPASGAMAEALASVVFTASSLTIGATTTNIFTGATGHSSVTWRLFDVTTITSYSHVGDVLQAVGGTSGVPSQLLINTSAEAFYYVVITALNAAWTEVLCAITPTT